MNPHRAKKKTWKDLYHNYWNRNRCMILYLRKHWQ